MDSISATSSIATSDPYSDTQLLLKCKKGDSNLRFMEISSPVAGGYCAVGYVNISQSKNYSCSYSLNSNSCHNSASYFTDDFIICKTGDCSDNVTFLSINSTPIKSSQFNGTFCNNFVSSQKFDITISSSGKSFKIDLIKLTITQINISMFPQYQVKTVINVTLTPQAIKYSGNPGYWFNKPIIVEKAELAWSLYDIADSQGFCVENTPITTSSTLNILFGQNVVYQCTLKNTQNPCTNNLYIDQIISQSLTIKKWARHSNTAISITGTGSNANSCQSEQTILNIIYTVAGWVQDPQNYIIGAEITKKSVKKSGWNKKYLKINWIYIDPSTIATPSENYFYTYFSYVWKPLREYFGVY